MLHWIYGSPKTTTPIQLSRLDNIVSQQILEIFNDFEKYELIVLQIYLESITPTLPSVIMETNNVDHQSVQMSIPMALDLLKQTKIIEALKCITNALQELENMIKNIKVEISRLANCVDTELNMNLYIMNINKIMMLYLKVTIINHVKNYYDELDREQSLIIIEQIKQLFEQHVNIDQQVCTDLEDIANIKQLLVVELTIEQLTPQNLMILQQLSTYYVLTEQNDKAIQLLTSITSITTQTTMIIDEQTQPHIEKIKNLLETLLVDKANKLHLDIHIEDMTHASEMLAAAEAALQLNPASIEASYYRSIALIAKQENLTEAVELLIHFLSSSMFDEHQEKYKPKNILLGMIGETYFKLQQYTLAIQYLSAAINDQSTDCSIQEKNYFWNVNLIQANCFVGIEYIIQNKHNEGMQIITLATSKYNQLIPPLKQINILKVAYPNLHITMTISLLMKSYAFFMLEKYQDALVCLEELPLALFEQPTTNIINYVPMILKAVIWSQTCDLAYKTDSYMDELINAEELLAELNHIIAMEPKLQNSIIYKINQICKKQHLITKAENLLINQDIANAKATFNEAIGIPAIDNHACLCGLARIAYLQGNYSTALEHINSALSINNNNPTAYVLKAAILLFIPHDILAKQKILNEVQLCLKESSLLDPENTSSSMDTLLSILDIQNDILHNNPELKLGKYKQLYDLMENIKTNIDINQTSNYVTNKNLVIFLMVFVFERLHYTNISMSLINKITILENTCEEFKMFYQELQSKALSVPDKTQPDISLAANSASMLAKEEWQPESERSSPRAILC